MMIMITDNDSNEKFVDLASYDLLRMKILMMMITIIIIIIIVMAGGNN